MSGSKCCWERRGADRAFAAECRASPRNPKIGDIDFARSWRPLEKSSPLTRAAKEGPNGSQPISRSIELQRNPCGSRRTRFIIVRQISVRHLLDRLTLQAEPAATASAV